MKDNSLRIQRQDKTRCVMESFQQQRLDNIYTSTQSLSSRSAYNFLHTPLYVLTYCRYEYTVEIDFQSEIKQLLPDDNTVTLSDSPKLQQRSTGGSPVKTTKKVCYSNDSKQPVKGKLNCACKSHLTSKFCQLD